MIEKEKALSVVKSLIELPGSTLDTKYSHSHEKVAVIYKEHTIQISGGDEKFLEYIDIKIPLSNNEYKAVYTCFNEELKKRKTNATVEKFHSLEQTLEKFGKIK